jgi:hypothetical protein
MNSPFSPQALAWLYEEESSFSIHYFSNARQDTIMNPHTSNNAMGSDKKIGKPTAMKCSEPSETTLDKDQYSRMRNAYNWYTLLAKPRRVTMHRILDYTKGADFTREDVGLLPWNPEGNKVIEEAMKSIKKEKKEKTEKKQKKKKKETFLKEELGNSLTSLDTSLNSSSDYMNASFTSMESSMNSSGGFLDASFNSCLDLDDTRYEIEKGEESETGGFEVNCELLQTIKAEEECISNMTVSRQKWLERRQEREDQQKRERREEAKKNDDSEDARRQRAFKWYARLSTPRRKEFKRQVTDLVSADITEDDIDLLPWNLTGSRVSISEMNAITRASVNQ